MAPVPLPQQTRSRTANGTSTVAKACILGNYVANAVIFRSKRRLTKRLALRELESKINLSRWKPTVTGTPVSFHGTARKLSGARRAFICLALFSLLIRLH